MNAEQRNGNTKTSAKVLGAAFGCVDAISPKLAATAASHLFLTPLHYKLSLEQKQFLAKGAALNIPLGNRNLAGWRWGSGPTVLLIHGWSGCAGQFHMLVEELLKKGFSAISFDLPAHGASDGRQSNLPECVRAVKAAENYYGPFQGVIAHSFGALAVALAAADSKLCQAMVLVNPLAGAEHAVAQFGELAGIQQRIMKNMQTLLEQRFHVPFEEFSLARALPETSNRLLAIHDRTDRITPFAFTEELAKNGYVKSLHTTNGLGHRRILRNPEIVEKIVNFMGTPRGDARELLLSEACL